MIETPSSFDLDVLETLSKQFPTPQSALSEAINLNAILNLPKPTCQMVSDLHGAHDAVEHVLKSGSGNLRRKIEQVFMFDLSQREKDELCTLIMYPTEKLPLLLRKNVKSKKEENDFYIITLYRLVQLCRRVSAKYTRSKVSKALPTEFQYIISELLSPQEEEESKRDYYKNILQGIIEIGSAAEFCKALCLSIQRLSVDKVYVVGDIYDRGDDAEGCVELLKTHPNVEFILGNHDALWAGASLGSDVCIASVLRISVRYNNINTLEAGYGISLSPLLRFADMVYKDDPCERFLPKVELDDPHEALQLARMQKAMAVIQFKLERGFALRRPYWHFDHRNFLHKIRPENGKLYVTLNDGKEYEMMDNYFPTIDFEQSPYELSEAERNLVLHFRSSFLHSSTLQDHINYIIYHGGMYKIHNDLLLLHAGIPVDDEGNFIDVQVDENTFLSGNKLFSYLDRRIRESFSYLDQFSLASDIYNIMPETRQRSYTDAEDARQRFQSYGRDLLYWLWCHPDSPLFQRTAMKTFESYFIDDKDAKKEKNSVFFELRDDESVVAKWLAGFGLTSNASKVVCGHTPVKLIKGENAVKANGKLIVIDGGFSEAYLNVTGIGGFTLVESSHGLFLSSHHPFEGRDASIHENKLMVNELQVVDRYQQRNRVFDTQKGLELQKRRDRLTDLVFAYKGGIIKIPCRT
ncbi:hypothetical protein P9112_012152 [Eukaryota sp. TZLM1-RC]